MSRFETIEDVWDFLDSIPMFQKSGTSAANFSLANIRAFCEKLGNPQDTFPSIHVAGTNGKGTTCYLLEQIYSKGGYKTGLFTSPHLLRYNERVRVGGKEIPDTALLEFFQQTEELHNHIKLTYFEISTALAFWYFAQQKVDIAIIEVGLGGRLDSTNIITPEVSVITSIGLDHQNVLGDTMEEIAREKGGIIKNNIPVILGKIDEAPRNQIQKIAMQKNAEVYSADDINPEWNSGEVALKDGDIQLQTNFKEAVNKWNVACAWLISEILQQNFPIGSEIIKSSIQSFSGAPGRFEKLHPRYAWYFSGSHNEQAIKSSLQAVEDMKPVSETVLVFSAMKDKLNEEILSKFKGFKKAYFVEQEGDRAAKFSDIEDQISAVLLDENRFEIILNELKTELVIFMGSFYFYPIAKRWTSNVS